jgi:CHAT domain-containing protein/tetratricopeptide (TPR) repeat protein
MHFGKLKMIKLIAPLFLLLALAAPVHAYTQAELEKDVQHSEDIYRSGDVQGARNHAQAVYDKATAAFGSASADTLYAGITLANMMRGVGDDAQALGLLKTLHSTATASFSQYAPIRIKVSVAYANVLSDLGQAQKAVPLHVDAAAAAETLLGADHETTLVFYFNLAKTYEILGYAEQALAVYRQIEASYGRIASPENLMQRGNVAAQIARTLYQMDNVPEALAAYRRALPLLADYWGLNHPRVLEQKLVFGYALWRADQSDEVAWVVDSLFASATLAYGPNSVFYGDVLELQALTLSKGGPQAPLFAQALSLMAQSITLKEAQLDPTHNALGRPMLEYAAMLRDAGQFGTAAQFALKAEKAGSASRDLLIQSLVGAVDAGQMVDSEAAAELFRILQQSSTSEAGFASIQLAARAALTSGADAALFRQVTDSALRQSGLEAQLLEASMRPLAERDSAQEAALRGQIAENASTATRAQTALDAKHPKIADLIGGGALSITEAQALLGPEGALVVVDYGEYRDSPVFAMAMTEAGVGYTILPDWAEDYAAAVEQVRASISLKLGTRAAAPLDASAAATPMPFSFLSAEMLYDRSIGQVFAINGKRKHLYLDLRGPLGAIPPQMLITKPTDDTTTEQTASWLVRDIAITVLPSVYALKLASLPDGRSKPALPLLGFANPVYTATGADGQKAGGQALRGALTHLPETEGELLQVATALKAPAEVQRLGLDASEAALKGLPLADYGVLYLATHGLVSGDAVGDAVPGEPALALTGGDGEDGLLTATEIAKLKLNADLVVLSACNTAVGDVPGGQALSGLARPFTYAGARSLMVSHWPVESRSAVWMMTDIFDHRAADPMLSAAEAQREAILSMIDAWSHPAYWAPFVLVGDPG